jgi:hypothetical protein
MIRDNVTAMNGVLFNNRVSILINGDDET